MISNPQPPTLLNGPFFDNSYHEKIVKLELEIDRLQMRDWNLHFEIEKLKSKMKRYYWSLIIITLYMIFDTIKDIFY